MEELLRHQREDCLSTWLTQKGVQRTGDDVGDIMSYYSYLDLLSIPNDDSEQVFTNNEVLMTIIEQSEWYMHPTLNLVNKSFNEVLTGMRCDTIFRDMWWYADAKDMLKKMDWWHMSKNRDRLSDISLQCVMKCTASSGYWFKPLPTTELIGRWIDYSQLMNTVAKHSDCADRYYRLFISFMAAAEEQRDDTYDSEGEEIWTNYRLPTILASSIKSGDEKIFNFVWDEEDLDLSENLDYFTCVYNAAYYNRSSMLSRLTSTQFVDSKDDTDFVYASAYCGGCYKEMSEYLSAIWEKVMPPTRDSMWKVINQHHKDSEMVPFTIKNIGLLIELLRGCQLIYDIDTICNVFYLSNNIDYTLEEFKELWSIVRDLRESNTQSGKMCVDVCLELAIGALLSSYRYEEIRYLMTGREEYDDLDIDSICNPKKEKGGCATTMEWMMNTLILWSSV